MFKLSKIIMLSLLLGISVMVKSSPLLAQTFTIVAFGDSLSAGYGLNADEAFPAVLEKRLLADGYDVKIINAGISGDTSQGGVSRVETIIAQNPSLVILELGANDALRGISPSLVEQNLDLIITRLLDANIEVLLAGMFAPPNMGKEYANEFAAIYTRLSEKHSVTLYPFFLDGVMAETLGGADAKLVLPDGIHPNAEGIKVMVDRFLPTIKPLIPSFSL